MPEQQTVFRNYGFVVEIQGERVGFFLRLSGLGAATDVIEYREGGAVANVRKLPGRTEVQDVTLEHGVANSASLWKWFDTSMQGNVERRNVSIVLLSSDGQNEVARWDLTSCWLRKCEISDFDARGNDVLIQRMTLVTEAVEYGPGASAA